MLGKTSTEYSEMNSVVTILEKLPDGYKDIEVSSRFHRLVGTKGKDWMFEYKGLTFSAKEPTQYVGDDDGETVQKPVSIQRRKVARFMQNNSDTIKIEQVASVKTNKVSTLTSFKDFYELGKSIGKGVISFRETLIQMKEDDLRAAFYRATNLRGEPIWAAVYQPHCDRIDEVVEGTIESVYKKIVQSLHLEEKGFIIWSKSI